MQVDQSKEFIFLWVPGTMGHEAHPGFIDALNKVIPGRYQIFHVDYPASWHMATSVPAGRDEMRRVLRELAAQKLPHQKICVGGSSQGSWVISEAYEDVEVAAIPHKTVMFGHPGVDDDGHYPEYKIGERVWEINHPEDAVTFDWDGREKEIAEAFSGAQRFKFRSILKVLGLVVRHPIRLFRFTMLVAYHARLLRFNTSPHDYTPTMPLAVYWMIHDDVRPPNLS